MKKTTILMVFIGYFSLSSILTGCFNVNKNYPVKHDFVLSASRSETFSPSASNGILKIQRFYVSPRFNGQGFVYKTGPLSYESDFYNRFFIPPGEMIAEDVGKWLSGSGLFKYVMDFSSPVEATFELSGVVSALYGDYSNMGTPKAVLEIQFFLVRTISSRRVIVFGHTYRQETPIKENSPDALAAGWNLALDRILTRFETDLKHLDLSQEQIS